MSDNLLDIALQIGQSFIWSENSSSIRLAHAQALLKEDCFPLPLPNDAFVFVILENYKFHFVKLSEGGNPPVYYYVKGQSERDFVKVTNTFEEFIIQCSQITKTGG